MPAKAGIQSREGRLRGSCRYAYSSEFTSSTNRATEIGFDT